MMHELATSHMPPNQFGIFLTKDQLTHQKLLRNVRPSSNNASYDKLKTTHMSTHQSNISLTQDQSTHHKNHVVERCHELATAHMPINQCNILLTQTN